jgi:hypothetical protein
MKSPFSEFNTDQSPVLFPVALRDVGWKRRDGTYDPIHGSKAIVRLNETGTSAYPLSVVSNTYKLVTNRELFDAVEQTFISRMSTDTLTGVQITDTTSHHGRNCYRQYIFPNMKCDIGARSPIAFRTIVQNGYGGSALRLLSGAIEFWCSNGMVRGEYEQLYRRHTTGLRVHHLDSTITESIRQFWTSAEEYRRWTTKPITREQTMNFFRSIARSPSFFDALSDQWLKEVDQRGMNVWSAYSTLTYYASHNEGDFAGRYDPTTVAHNMTLRELSVSKWIQTDEWKQLVDA